MAVSPYWVTLWVYVCLWMVIQVVFVGRVRHEPVKSRQPGLVFAQNLYGLLHLCAITGTLYVIDIG